MAPLPVLVVLPLFNLITAAASAISVNKNCDKLLTMLLYLIVVLNHPATLDKNTVEFESYLPPPSSSSSAKYAQSPTAAGVVTSRKDHVLWPTAFQD